MPPFTATSVVVKMNSDGTVIANVGLTDIGQGSTTAFAQIAAERLRFPLDKVRVTIEKDTDRDPYDWQTVASKGLMITGNALILACEDLLAKAYELGGPGAARRRLRSRSRRGEDLRPPSTPSTASLFAQLALGYTYPDGSGVGGPLIGVGRYIAQGLTNLNKDTGQGLPALDWTYGAHGIIVEVNPTTGAYHILKIASAYDVGKAINPELIRGQCIGGMVQGLGTALCEGYIYDQQGHLLNPSFTDNKIPTSKDLPDEIECIIVETGAGRRTLRRARRRRASDDLGRSRARQRDPRRDRSGADAHADPQRGRLAGDEQQGAGRDLDHQDPCRLLPVAPCGPVGRRSRGGGRPGQVCRGDCRRRLLRKSGSARRPRPSAPLRSWPDLDRAPRTCGAYGQEVC